MGRPHERIYSDCSSPVSSIGLDLLEGCGVVVKLV